MKRYLLVLFFLLIGCVKPVITPKEPQFKPVNVYVQPNGIVIIDRENLEILMENLKQMQEYQKKLLKQLQEK